MMPEKEKEKNKLYSRLEQDSKGKDSFEQDSFSPEYHAFINSHYGDTTYGEGTASRMIALQTQRNQMLVTELDELRRRGMFAYRQVEEKENIFWRFVGWFGKTVYQPISKTINKIKIKIQLEIKFRKYKRRAKKLGYPLYRIGVDRESDTSIQHTDFSDWAGG